MLLQPLTRSIASVVEDHDYCNMTNRSIPYGHKRGCDHDVASDGWAINPAETDANPNWCDGDVTFDSTQCADCNSEMASGPSSGGDGDGGAATARGGAKGADVDVLLRLLSPVGGAPETIIDGGSWNSLFGYK